MKTRFEDIKTVAQLRSRATPSCEKYHHYLSCGNRYGRIKHLLDTTRVDADLVMVNYTARAGGSHTIRRYFKQEA